MAKSKKTADEYLVLDGMNFPPSNTRKERGQRVKAADLPDRSIGWLERDGHIAALDGLASAPALELADQYADLKLTDVEGTGKGDSITKPDVEKYIAEHGLEASPPDPANADPEGSTNG